MKTQPQEHLFCVLLFLRDHRIVRHLQVRVIEQFHLHQQLLLRKIQMRCENNSRDHEQVCDQFHNLSQVDQDIRELL